MSNAWLAYRNNMTELGEPKKDILYYFTFRLSTANTLIHGLLKKPSPTPSQAEDENNEPLQNAELRLAFHIKQHNKEARHMPEMVGDRNHRSKGAGMRSARP
ncbi:hypothetical protein TNIN_335831 [Trichonephila inaurata madagascariensis]|uniref:Uncharacterized protein n=1 Tax=Trichonephila inaurata madagascariensis TaxID=2747483 RepID=A0A8X6Y3D7_9ARAC|nr:hypothetical protein TNIN_335831 [Trichonephila inaurata madagascariensis]